MHTFSTPKQVVLPEYTFGVSTTGNTAALQMALASVLSGNLLPGAILIRSEGKMPAFASYYLEQLSELARIKGVAFSINVATSKGVRYARDWLVEHCRTSYLWMGDDDAIYAPHCLQAFVEAVNFLDANLRPDEEWGFVVGNKPDLNNRRGYEDFSTESIDSAQAANHDSFNQFYHGTNRVLLHQHLDTGNVLLHARAIEAAEIAFNAFPEVGSCNSGGEDTLFALQCGKAGLQGYFATRADSVHLEKPEIRFNEFAARKTQLLRECQLLGIDPQKVEAMMPWVKVN